MFSRDRRKIFEFHKKNSFCIEGRKYCKRLLAHDYLIVLNALEKTCPQYIMQRKKYSMKLTAEN